MGKLRAEKAAWRVAEERGLKLTTICPGLIRGPEFFNRNTTSTIAYLKGKFITITNNVPATCALVFCRHLANIEEIVCVCRCSRNV